MAIVQLIHPSILSIVYGFSPATIYANLLADYLSLGKRSMRLAMKKNDILSSLLAGFFCLWGVANAEVKIYPSTVESGSLKATELDKSIDKNRDQIAFCLNKAEDSIKKFGGDIVVNFKVSSDGSVSTVTTPEGTIPANDVQTCLTDRWARFLFNSSEAKPTTAKVRLHLVGSEESGEKGKTSSKTANDKAKAPKGEVELKTDNESVVNEFMRDISGPIGAKEKQTGRAFGITSDTISSSRKMGYGQVSKSTQKSESKKEKKTKKRSGFYMGNIDSIGGLPQPLIKKVLKRRSNQFKACFLRQVQKNPKLNGTVKVKFTIGKSGSVAKASISKSSVGNKSVENCIKQRVRTLRFPAPKGGGIVMVKAPFSFSN